MFLKQVAEISRTGKNLHYVPHYTELLTTVITVCSHYSRSCADPCGRRYPDLPSALPSTPPSLPDPPATSSTSSSPWSLPWKRSQQTRFYLLHTSLYNPSTPTLLPIFNIHPILSSLCARSFPLSPVLPSPVSPVLTAYPAWKMFDVAGRGTESPPRMMTLIIECWREDITSSLILPLPMRALLGDQKWSSLGMAGNPSFVYSW